MYAMLGWCEMMQRGRDDAQAMREIMVCGWRGKEQYDEGSVRHGKHVFNEAADVQGVVRLVIVAVHAQHEIKTRKRVMIAASYSLTSMPQAANSLLWLPHVGFET